MGLGSSLKKAVKSVTKTVSSSAKYLNLATATSEGIKALTGMSSSDQYSLGLKTALGLGGNSFMSTLGDIFNNLVSGAVGLGSDYLQSQINLEQQKALAKYNAEQQSILNKQAFDQNVQMWNMQNEYNTPSEQMKRIQAAGLNPNLVYGGGNITGNTASSAPELQAAKFDTGAFHPVDTRIERAQLALAMESQYQQIQNQKIQNDLDRQRLALSAQASKRDDALAQAQIKNMSANLGLRFDEFNYNMNSPKSWIGRDWQDIKSIGKEAADLVKKSVKSSYRYNPLPMYRGNH